MKQGTRMTALLTALALLLGLLAGCGESAAAAVMKLRKAQGKVSVSDGAGKDLEAERGLGLYSGYGVKTKSESYAWIDLDEVKLTKLDQDSAVEITKNGGNLELEVTSGALFFNITEPLTDDETLNIRTSSMVIGIRGTCGWVTQDAAALLEGTVEVTAGAQSATVTAGEMAVLTAGGALEVVPFSAGDIPAFVRGEVDGDEDPMEEEPEQSQPGTSPSGEEAAVPTHITHQNSAGRIEYTYRPWGVERKEYQTGSGETFRVEEYLYDEQNRCIQYGFSTQDTSQDYIERYDYDEQGRLIRDERTSPDGVLQWTTDYTYSGSGTIRDGVRTFPDGTQAATQKDITDLQPEMDLLHGYVAEVSLVQRYKNPGDAVYSCEETFDGGGLLIQRVHYLDGQLSSYLTHEYDSQGRRVRSDLYSAAGAWQYTLTYEYEN